MVNGTFASALRRAKNEHHLSNGQLAARLMVSPAAVDKWLYSGSKPDLTSLDAVGSMLDPVVAQELMAERRRRCAWPDCSRTFYQATARQLFCMARCAQAASNARKGKRKDGALHPGRRLQAFQKAVASMCRQCEAKTSICRDASCPLRPVSPFPLAVR